MRWKELRAHHLLTPTADATANATLKRLKCGTRLGLGGGSCRSVGEGA
jgi:hypothetical protein